LDKKYITSSQRCLTVMDQEQNTAGFESLGMAWPMVLVRGVIMFISGLFIAIASVFNPDGSLMYGSEFSWLPVSGFVVILVGLTEAYDAHASKSLGHYFLHLQSGVFDLVAGCLISFSISGTPDRLSLLIVSYLVVKAILRTLLARAIQLPQRYTMTIGASVSILLGLLIWSNWPSPGAWFMSLCLGVDITLRGWSQILFSFWLKNQAASRN
jgi:uncharacterized membrane protein HdeD (DUF308 family)